jgi:hypothetical protein
MPEKETIARARRDRREGKSPSTQAGEFIREEIHHVREGKHGARSSKQAIAIGLSKARRAGVKVPRARRGSAAASKQQAASTGGTKRARKRPSARRSAAIKRALRREGHSAASHRALSRHAHACRSFPHGRAAVCVGEEGRAHQGSESQKSCGPEGCQDAGPPFLTTSRDDAWPRATGSIGSI